MIRTLLSVLLLSCAILANAQTVVKDRKGAKIIQVAVLPDRNYNFEHIHAAKSIPFVSTDSVKKTKAYWIRAIINNQFGETQNYDVSIFPNVSSEFFFFNKPTNQWAKKQSSILNYDRSEKIGTYPLQIERNTVDTVYFRVDLRGGHIIKDKLKVSVMLKLKENNDQLKQNIKTAWLVGVIVLFLFFLNYLYIYFGLRDKPVLFYLLIQVGGMIYLTAYWGYFKLFSPIVFSYILGDYLSAYNLDQLLVHVGIMLIFYSYMQLTRSYLNIKSYFPLLDTLLRYGLYIYIIASIVNIATNMLGYNLEYYTLKADNVYCGILSLLILYITVKAYLRKIALAEAYLFANLVPFTVMLSMPLYHLFISNLSDLNLWIPIMGVISQALGFSIALVSRIKTIQETIKIKEIESKELAFNLIEIEYQNRLNEMQMVKLNADMQGEINRNQLLQGRLELHQRELASSTLNMVQKSELLTFLKDQLQKLNWLDRYHTKKNLHELNLLLESNIKLDSEWGKFKMHFEQVHPDFFQNLKRDYPLLTQKEVRLYTYFQMTLSHKEIAALLGIDPASVRRAKTRLYKKMGISVRKEQSGDEQAGVAF